MGDPPAHDAGGTAPSAALHLHGSLWHKHKPKHRGGCDGAVSCHARLRLRTCRIYARKLATMHTAYGAALSKQHTSASRP